MSIQQMFIEFTTAAAPEDWHEVFTTFVPSVAGIAEFSATLTALVLEMAARCPRGFIKTRNRNGAVQNLGDPSGVEADQPPRRHRVTFSCAKADTGVEQEGICYHDFAAAEALGAYEAMRNMVSILQQKNLLPPLPASQAPFNPLTSWTAELIKPSGA